MLQPAQVGICSPLKKKTHAFQGTESKLHHERRFARATHGGQGIYICATVQQQRGDRDGSPVMNRLGDPPASGEFGASQFWVGNQLRADVFDPVRHHGIPERTDSTGDQQIGNGTMRWLIAMPMIPAYELPQQGMRLVTVISANRWMAADIATGGCHVAAFKYRKESTVGSGFHIG